MHEQTKLEEALYFYSRMLSERESNEFFTYNLSAFLSAARSVLQYALKEAGTKPEGKEWYNSYMTSKQVLSFFKDKRDFNIHTEPVKPIRNLTINTPPLTVQVSISASIELVKANGDVEARYLPETPNPIGHAIEAKGTITTRYHFADWLGNETVETLCKLYIDEIQSLIGDGISKGLLAVQEIRATTIKEENSLSR